MSVQQQTPTQDQYEDAKAYVRDFLQEKYPNLSLNPTTVLHDLLVEPGAELAALNEANMDAVIRSGSVAEVLKDPNAADPAIVDRLLSNWGVTRAPGQTARGQISLVFSKNSTVIVAASAQFVVNELTFSTEIAFVSTVGTPSTGSERKLVARSDGTYVMVIDVVADADGSQYNIPRNTTIQWPGAIPGFVTAFASVDFSGGLSTETNAELVSRMQDGIAAKTMGGRNNIRAMLRGQFPSLQDLAIIGYRDNEMNRDGHNIFGIKTGGKVDFYVRTADSPLTTRHQLTGVLVDAVTKQFSIAIPRDTCQGAYAVSAVFPEDANTLLTGLEVVDTYHGMDLSTDGEYVPEITTVDEAYFSKYQTITVTVLHPDLDVSGMTEMESTVDFQVDLLGLPDIVALQDFVADREIRNPAGDYLVRAAFPVLVSVTLEIVKEATDEDVDVAAVVSNVVNRINAIPMGYGKLHAAIVVDAAQSVLTGLSVVKSPIEMTGVLIDPSQAQDIRLSSRHELTVPTDYSVGRSPRTTSFYASAGSVSVSVIQSSGQV